VHKNMK